jgi:hypothetical protein
MFVSDMSDPVELIRSGLAALAAEDRSGWSAPARAERLIGLRAVQERVDAAVVRSVADCDAVAAWEEDALGPVSWLAAKTALVRHSAARLLQAARLVGAHEATAQALAEGTISVPHVELLAAAAQRRHDLYAEHEEMLLHTAAAVEVQDFPAVTRRWALYADDVLAHDDARFGFERRGITLSPTTGGSVVSGSSIPRRVRSSATPWPSSSRRRARPTCDPLHNATPTASCSCASDRRAVSSPSRVRSRASTRS